MSELVLGPMFSGKSTELIRRAKRYKAAGCAVLLLQPAGDSRSGRGRVASRDGASLEALRVEALADVALPEDVRPDALVVALDEAQMFPDLLQAVRRWRDAGVYVMAAGLDSDFRQEPFDVLQLVVGATRVLKLTAVCDCGADAALTIRRDFVVDNDALLVGDADVYRPVCGACVRSAVREAPLDAETRARFVRARRAFAQLRAPDPDALAEAAALRLELPLGCEQRVHLELLLFAHGQITLHADTLRKLNQKTLRTPLRAILQSL